MSEMHSRLIHKVEEFVTLKMFHCGICQQILQIPVILTENFGNVCHSCYEDARQHTNVIGLENRILTEFLKTLNLPCENESEGCIERIPYDKIHKHKIFCRYQTVECELAPECSWKGQYKDLVEHFRDHNKENILKSIDDPFETTVPEENILSTQILKTVYGLFILHMKVTGNKLHYLLFAVDDLEKKLRYHFVMKFTDESETELNFKCVPIEGSKRFMTFEEASSTVVNLDIVKCNFASWKMYVILDIDEDIYKMSKYSMDCTRCSKCWLYIPNYDKKIVECPECFTQLQNSDAKDTEMESPCIFKTSGNSVEFSSYPLHYSQLCYYHPWKCPVKDCGDQLLSYSQLITHIRVNHNKGGMCYFDGSCISLKSTITHSRYTTYKEFIYYVIVNDRIFEVIHSIDFRRDSSCEKYDIPVIEWKVIHIGPVEKRFKFEIEIGKECSVSETNWILYASRECHYNNSLSSEKITLSEELSRIFVYEKCLNYKLKISRL